MLRVGWWLTSQKHNDNFYVFFWQNVLPSSFFSRKTTYVVSQFIKFKAVYPARYEPSPVDCWVYRCIPTHLTHLRTGPKSARSGRSSAWRPSFSLGCAIFLNSESDDDMYNWFNLTSASSFVSYFYFFICLLIYAYLYIHLFIRIYINTIIYIYS